MREPTTRSARSGVSAQSRSEPSSSSPAAPPESGAVVRPSPPRRSRSPGCLCTGLTGSALPPSQASSLPPSSPIPRTSDAYAGPRDNSL